MRVLCHEPHLQDGTKVEYVFRKKRAHQKECFYYGTRYLRTGFEKIQKSVNHRRNSNNGIVSLFKLPWLKGTPCLMPLNDSFDDHLPSYEPVSILYQQDFQYCECKFHLPVEGETSTR